MNRQGAKDARREAWWSSALAAFLVSYPLVARAHAPTFAVYSKYEATTSGRNVVFVFAFDMAPVLSLLDRDGGHGKVDLADVGQYSSFFSKYLFDRFSVSNNGALCTHPHELGRFFWDENTHDVLAVTKFACGEELTDLTIRSLVTHDMPMSHELVGDLLHGRVLVRHFFSGDDIETRVTLGSLPASGVVAPRRVRQRNRFAYVAVPDEERRYEALASAELGVAPAAASLPPARARTILWGWMAIAAVSLIVLKVKGAVSAARANSS
jgi:hypothetical protein